MPGNNRKLIILQDRDVCLLRELAFAASMERTFGTIQQIEQDVVGGPILIELGGLKYQIEPRSAHNVGGHKDFSNRANGDLQLQHSPDQGVVIAA